MKVNKQLLTFKLTARRMHRTSKRRPCESETDGREFVFHISKASAYLTLKSTLIKSLPLGVLGFWGFGVASNSA